MSNAKEPTRPAAAAGADVIAWAIDKHTRLARHVSDVPTGRACNCVCPACGFALLGVNAGPRTLRPGQRRPHFRHDQGVEKQRCRLVAGRAALERMLREEGVFELPARRFEGVIEGASGHRYTHTIVTPAERVRIKAIEYDDEALGVLILDDGRRVKVVVRGTLRPNKPDNSLAIISVELDPAEAVQLSPQDLRTRLFLDVDSVRWLCHWKDAEVRAEAEGAALALAEESADWLNEALATVPIEWRRESALHLAVKKIIEESGRMYLPPLEVTVRRLRRPVAAERQWSEPAKTVAFDSVVLENRLGRIVPDVVAKIGAHSMLIEVVVTHPVNEDKLVMLETLGLPCLEINLSRSHGRVTLDELRRIVIDDLSAKRWLHHPRLARMRAQLEQEVKEELEHKTVEHIEAIRTAAEASRQRALDALAANQVAHGGQSTPERFTPATGRDPRRFSPRPTDPPALLSGRALERWKQAHPERYAELKAEGFFDRLMNPAKDPSGGTS